jgi:hypothetical protein
VAAVRELFGNPQVPLSHPTWPLEHAQPLALAASLLVLAIAVPLALHRYRVRTTD